MCNPPSAQNPLVIRKRAYGTALHEHDECAIGLYMQASFYGTTLRTGCCIAAYTVVAVPALGTWYHITTVNVIVHIFVKSHLLL